MSKLPEIKHIKLIDKKRVIRLAQKVRDTLMEEKEFLEKKQNDQNNNFSGPFICN